MQLLDHIDRAFEAAPLPLKEDLVDNSLSDQDYGSQLAADLDRWRTVIPDKKLLQDMHQELRKLSAATTRWIVPHYLRYALTEEAKYSRMEVSFFVLSLVSRHPDEDLQISARLSLMTDEQFGCVSEVLAHLRGDPDWGEYMGEDFDAALTTLSRLRSSQSRGSE